MTGKKDTRYREIGGRHRASSRYAMMMYRVSNPTGKNSCYSDVIVDISEEDFISWFMANDFEGCSVDRIESTKNYEVGNLQLIPTGVNSGKDKIKSFHGLCECYGCKLLKPVADFVKESRRITGHSTICKECDRERYHERKQRKEI